MQIFINDLPENIDSGFTVSDVLRHITRSPETGIAVAVNLEVIPKARWKETALNENDKVLIIQATQGG